MHISVLHVCVSWDPREFKPHVAGLCLQVTAFVSVLSLDARRQIVSWMVWAPFLHCGFLIDPRPLYCLPSLLSSPSSCSSPSSDLPFLTFFASLFMPSPFFTPPLLPPSSLPPLPSHLPTFPPSLSPLFHSPATKANRLELAFCIKLKDKFDPRTGKDFIFLIMRYFAKLVLHRYVRPFILLIYGFTLTVCLALVFQVQIGLSQTIALPKVGDCVHACVWLCVCLCSSACLSIYVVCGS